MTLLHKIVLCLALAFLGLSLVVPGAAAVVRPSTGLSWLVAEGIDARNHLRTLNAMMAALGLVALWAGYALWAEPGPGATRHVVLALGVVMAALVAARLYSVAADGVPGAATILYLAVEAALAVLFLAWPPPA
ncbi:MAG: DUF4345 family protein [Alphaproteobacteria bacterium]